MQANKVQRGIQTVRAEAPTEVKALVEQLQKAFSDFKAEHTAQLEDAKKGTSDALQALKVDRINAEIATLQKSVDDANAKIAAALLNGGGEANKIKDAEYSKAFQAHFKAGEVQAALNKGVADDGGFLAPTEWDRTITDKLRLVSPMRIIADVQTTSKNAWTKLFNIGGTASGWVGEAAPRPQTGTSQFKALTFTTGEIYANPAATQGILDDAEVNLEAWLAGEVEGEFAKQEGSAFVSGDGTNKPNGFLTYATGGTNATTHPFGAIEVVGSGAVGTITADALIDLVQALPEAFTAGARFVMNRNTMTLIRKLKDADDNYLWQPSFQAGVPSTLLGYPVTEMPDMPGVAANALSIAFGDFKRSYLVIDRVGVRVLRDPYSNKPYVMFYTTKRVGGGLVNPEPLKVMKINAA